VYDIVIHGVLVAKSYKAGPYTKQHSIAAHDKELCIPLGPEQQGDERKLFHEWHLHKDHGVIMLIRSKAPGKVVQHLPLT
jgi:hypothetical protein